MADMTLLDEALRGLDRQTQHVIADALACQFHNEGYALQGNTEANDVEWFARNLYEEHYRHCDYQWRENTPDETEKVQWRKIACSTLRVLPRFQERVAHRLISLSKVTRDIERSLRPDR